MALRVCVTRSGRVAFLRRWHKNAECINRGVRYPGRCPGLRAATGLTARLNGIRPCAVMPSTVTTGRISYACPCRMGKWLGRAVSPNVAHSPGQRPGWGVRRDLYIWHFGGSAAKMPRAPWRVTSLIMPPRGVYPFVCYALLARGIFAPLAQKCRMY